jgi:hypothetical protein
MPNPGLTKSMIAEAAILPYRVLKFGAADGQVVQSSAAADAHVGVSDLGQDTAGARLDVIVDGIADITAGAALTRGALLTSDAQGRVIAATAAAGTNVRVIGVAMASAGAAGEVIPVAVSPGTFQG